MGRIEIKGLDGWGHHGVLEHERTVGQRFLVDAVLEVDLTAAGDTDQLEDTVDYRDLAIRLYNVVGGEPCQLLEALAARLLDECMTDPRVTAAEVTVTKPNAPLSVPARGVAVTVERTRR
ncbi:MAG: dihydroneopterin aldolase [Nitriliruptorales bacterium]|nr:dihydroneopterin aldolase [Nitriliruptorales bacterium]